MGILRLIQKLCAFVALGLLFATPGEILNQILARQDPDAFRHTLVSYAVLLIVGYFVGEILRITLKMRGRRRWCFTSCSAPSG